VSPLVSLILGAVPLVLQAVGASSALDDVIADTLTSRQTEFRQLIQELKQMERRLADDAQEEDRKT
jgi:hypothetical protein